ncbi:hypothetical protein ACIHFE_14605 [Streptomyces sp. NPDC052396]|uniref:hypothetical protein n=1 Tax=Streptomyces sp. NPDC052396 TaxID=3365689 RepID=UPI0037D8031B
MSLRKTPVIALMACAAALSLTACGPDKSSADTDHATKSAAPARTGSAQDCPTARPGHKLVIVDSRSAESGEIEYHGAKPVCGANGITWQGTSEKGRSHLAHEGSPRIRLLNNQGDLTESDVNSGNAKLSECWHHAKTTPHGPCYANAYDIVDKGWNTGITEMTQLPGN